MELALRGRTTLIINGLAAFLPGPLCPGTFRVQHSKSAQSRIRFLHPLKLLAGYDLRMKNILHIGAHTGQEAPFYKALGIENVVFVEAIPTVFEKLQKNLAAYPAYKGINAVCSEESGKEVQFNVSSNEGGSSSMLGLGNHARLYPEISYVETLTLQTVTADDLVAEQCGDAAFDFVVLDTQGAELHVLRGATNILGRAKALWIEVSEEPLYEGGCTFDEVSSYVRKFDFRLRHVNINRQGWGDALYVSGTAGKARPE